MTIVEPRWPPDGRSTLRILLRLPRSARLGRLGRLRRRVGGWELQVEPPDLRVEGRTVVALHLVRAFHRAPRRAQRAEALVLERLPRLQPRRLADHARAAHFLAPALGVDDDPVP